MANKKQFLYGRADKITIWGKHKTHETEIEIHGLTRKGKPFKATITVGDWYLPGMVEDIKKICKQRIDEGNGLNNQVRTAYNAD